MTDVHLPVYYFGTPVVLVSTWNEDGSTNITPISSAWALGDRYVLGIGTDSQAVRNLFCRPELVINLPSSDMVDAVERIAATTGRNPVPAGKADSYRFVADKWATAGWTPSASVGVAPDRIAQCPVQLEARVVQQMSIAAGDASAFEVVVTRAHVHPSILRQPNRVDVHTWNPLYYVFRHYFAQGAHVGSNFRASLLDVDKDTDD